ncbi:hypothetical protein KC343_g4118 [Hortaea werneckii]|uniref:Uncharacterized protein n=1 Tax=Hortaea werneckii TaxID=91943 RepID=A0A3M7HYB7_HORWE|nr:hypothetical protein KC323_g3164 [Hortaea werneckii]KAI7562207.1 hypothetical protein KC317_g8562 [Hortaea werneckii]KAI7614404.1 hypothetical protein KC346_g6940 [Hortaea werneckii]KAI7631296.1 hypothetical protein KC343_g4118 [Hortaea werneckii]KAI7670940.1 hypothetical protein KC319_g5727 [Hortaea werneckii]
MEEHAEHLIGGIAIARQINVADLKSKSGSKRKRVDHAPEIPWTVSRCNRLLRTLTSRIAILQRLAASNRLLLDSDSRHDAVKEEPAIETVAAATPSKDPEWLPQLGKGQPSRTYGGRTKSSRLNDRKRTVSKATQHTAGLSTPAVKRLLDPGTFSPTPNSKTIPRPKLGGPDRKARSHYSLPIKPSSAADEAYTNIVTAFGSFLHATRPGVPSSRKGARSLMSACLRKVPAYVQLEESCAQDEGANEDGERDISNEIYQELEAYGSTSGNGWTGLREVARADGVAKLKDAIEGGLIPGKTIEALIQACSVHEAIAEGQQIADSALLLERNGRDRILEKYLMFAKEKKAEAMVLRTLELDLDSDVLIHAHIRQELLHVVLRAATRPSDCPDAIVCIQRWLDRARSGFMEKQSGLRDLAVLLAAASLGQSGESETSCDRGQHLLKSLQRIAINVLCRNGVHQMYGQKLEPVANSFLLASVVASLRVNRRRTPLLEYAPEEVIQTLLPQADIRSGDETFITDVALCITRWDTASGDSFFTATTGALLDLGYKCTRENAKSVRNLVLANVRAYSERRQDKDILMFAEEIEDIVADCDGDDAKVLKVRTPAPKPSKRDMFRWEEGLCEWIAKTPLDGVAAKKLELGQKTPIEDRKDSKTFATLPTPPESDDPSTDQIPHALADKEAGPRRSFGKQKRNSTQTNVKRPQKRASVPKTVSPDEKENLVPSTKYESESELDELAMSAKKPRYAFNPPKQARQSHGIASKRTSTGSSTAWEAGDLGSEDELGL